MVSLGDTARMAFLKTNRESVGTSAFWEIVAQAVASRVRTETIKECAEIAKAYRDKCKPLFFEHNGPTAVLLAGAAEQIEVDIRALNREPVTSGE